MSKNRGSGWVVSNRERGYLWGSGFERGQAGDRQTPGTAHSLVLLAKDQGPPGPPPGHPSGILQDSVWFGWIRATWVEQGRV